MICLDDKGQEVFVGDHIVRIRDEDVDLNMFIGETYIIEALMREDRVKVKGIPAIWDINNFEKVPSEWRKLL